MKARTILLTVFGILVVLWLIPPVSIHLSQPMTHSISPGILVIFMVFAIPLAAIIGGCFIVALKIMKGNGGRKNHGDTELPADEAVLIQEMHRSLKRMEARVDALETILLERPAPPPATENEKTT
ncbi:MAG: hypothetical protein WD490_04575 [Opitutales bacterium]